MVDKVVFFIAAFACLAGAVGVIWSKNPVHSALSLVGTLFGIAIHFVNLGAHFLAAVQVVVYAGAIVVLFLFVIMLLGVDKSESLEVDPLGGQRPAAAVVAIAGVALLALLAVRGVQVSTGEHHKVAGLKSGPSNLVVLGRALFTDYVFAFEVTSVLLVIAVVGAVVLARRPPQEDQEVVPQ
ncbi:MAG: nuoJ [Actinomycetia bacterium]|nr:nuoJ [Actinomycetes bacterium]